MTPDSGKSAEPGSPGTEPAVWDEAELASLRSGVLYLLRREVGHAALAEDLCNEAFRIVIERLRQQPLDEPAQLASYVYRTAHNLVLVERRRAGRHRTMTGQQAVLEAVAVTALDPAAILQTRSNAAAVRKLLEEMPQVRDREVLVRVYLHDQDKDQVCRELGITSDNYKRIVYRARERFRALLGRRFAGSDL